MPNEARMDNVNDSMIIPADMDNENPDINDIVLDNSSWSIFSTMSKALWTLYLFTPGLIYLSFFVGKSCTLIITTIFILKHLSFSSSCLPGQ